MVRKANKDAMDPALERELMTELTRLRDELCGAAKGFCVSLDNRQNLGLFRIFSNVSIDKWRAVAKRLDLTGWLTLPIDRDIYPHLTTLQESLERLAYESEHDALTGLANRRAFERTLDLEIERARRAKTVMSLSIIDLDHFKSVNDTYGHPVGDQVLMRLSEIINREKRRYDLAARIGGEEFALIIPGAGQVKTRVMLERMLELISRENFAGENGENFSVTFSAGVTSFRGTSDISVSELVALTDKALYKAKENGRAQVQLAPLPEMETVPRQSLVHANEKKFLFTGKK